MKQFEVAGIPVIGATLAACAVFVTQWMWWGALFNDSWPQLNGLTEADLEVPYSWWVGGLAVIAAQVIGIAVILRNRDWPNIADAVTHIGGMSLLLAVGLPARAQLGAVRHRRRKLRHWLAAQRCHCDGAQEPCSCCSNAARCR